MDYESASMGNYVSPKSVWELYSDVSKDTVKEHDLAVDEVHSMDQK